ncbi:hypothetical protein VPNG_04026 [Cytospora leucostoma]|uniref:AB hydrolase-1 domain-containing protein n=1 Tax=Cytospora leucostoma TaxID=1230097 RepID=A0A423XDG2_9PEZI|nr:hypothetical protein VPNG_04026 [Cytospora leucostoma]
MDPSVIPALPPSLAARNGRHSRLREVEDTNYANHSAIRSHAGNESVAPASPEVISSLITSLSVISRPASAHFELPLEFLQTPSSPLSNSPKPHRGGSFGIDYGAFPQPSLSQSRRGETDLDEIAATAPVIKTSKPPSGFSQLTAPKSPERRDFGGLRSFLSGRSSSRPSSQGSSVSRDTDGAGLGSISVERGLSPASSPEPIRKAGSRDSWGKKASRSHKGLMYMSSKERLVKDNEERRRPALGNRGYSEGGLIASAMARTTSPRSEHFLAETPIAEGAPWDTEHPPLKAADGSISPTPRLIPTRDSSLRKTGANAKRSSRASKRHSHHGAIMEEEGYFSRGDKGVGKWADTLHAPIGLQEGETSESKRYSRKDIGTDGFLDPSRAATVKVNHYTDHFVTDTETEIDDGAPAPNIAQGKRRDREASNDRASRRRSGRSSPELRVKRSSSRLKRLSGPLSPRIDERSRDSGSEPNGITYERPQSADSIDDSVEVYLRSPRLSQKIRHPQTGRVISFSEVGDPEGSAVFCCVGMGLTRYITAFYDELALTLRLRLITPDRPGVGDSEAYADGTATPLSWPDDVYTICQALKITKFSILAHSAGAIYALATALRMPQHIRGKMHLLAPWIPPSQMSVFGASAQTPLPPTNAIPTSQRILRALPTPILKAANSSFMSATSSSLTTSLPKQKRTKRKPSGKDKDHTTSRASNHPILDKENHLGTKTSSDYPMMSREMVATEEMDQIRPETAGPPGTLSPTAAPSSSFHSTGHGMGESSQANTEEDMLIAAAESALAEKERQETYDTRLTQSIWELATTGANPAVDLLVCLERRHTIGFRYVDITRPVVIHHGSRDNRVPVENVKWLGRAMKRCEVRVLEGEGHGLMASAACMGGVLMEISKEWEDWMRLTGAAARKGR